MTELSAAGAARHLDVLRASLDADSTDPATQALFEAWAQRDTWRARSEALPLLVGVEPTAWPASTVDPERAEAEEILWRMLASGLKIDPDTDPAVSPLRVRAWAQTAGLTLPRALARLLDFISSVLPSAAAPDAGAEAEALVLRAQERETLLGAALMLVTKEPASCVDDDGRYDSRRIAALIRSRALLWFPLGPPLAAPAEIEALIARWIDGADRRAAWPGAS
jgi:hypothetical protein